MAPMEADFMKSLRLDRRLLRRRGWIPQQELDEALAELPDASHKIAPTEEAPARAAGEPEPPEGGESAP